jgi:hypothetical protein
VHCLQRRQRQKNVVFQKKLIHLGSNFRFNMNIIFMANIFLVVNDISVDSEIFLVTGFINIKIKSIQSFRDADRGRMYIHVFIKISTYICISI